MIGWIYRAADGLRRRALEHNHGRVGEDLAHRYLRKNGCTVVARNYRTPSGSGEVDLIAWHGTTLAFVEVKTRQRTDYGEPESAVDEEKQALLLHAARDYARRKGVEWRCTRFDIVSVVLGNPVRMEWIRDAFHRDQEPVRTL